MKTKHYPSVSGTLFLPISLVSCTCVPFRYVVQPPLLDRERPLCLFIDTVSFLFSGFLYSILELI